MSPKIKYYYREFRCQGCKKLLFRGILVDSEVEVKCKRCEKVNIYKGEPAAKYLCLLAGRCQNKIAIEK